MDGWDGMGWDGMIYDGVQPGITPVVHKLGRLQLITICIFRIRSFAFRIFYIYILVGTNHK